MKLIWIVFLAVCATACGPGVSSDVKVTTAIRQIESEAKISIPTNYSMAQAGIWRFSGRDGVTTISLVRLEVSEEDYQSWLSSSTSILNKNELWTTPIKNEALERRFPWWNRDSLRGAKLDYYHYDESNSNKLLQFGVEVFKHRTNHSMFIKQKVLERVNKQANE
jgi:hypothetical protein